MSDEDYMKEAIREAEQALREGEVPIGGVVVCNGRIIAKAHNLTETLTDPTAHAEMQLIGMAAEQIGGKYLDKCTLYVTVEPCPMCAAALSWAQIGKIVYGADDPKRGYSLFSPSLLHPKTIVSKGVMQEKCGSIVSDFFKNKRR
ncbi:MAG: nucleoside deaminase [Bacteroidales bacterium]|nr:nucleoside deaminase [Candidatus Cacconaster merdequi]